MVMSQLRIGRCLAISVLLAALLSGCAGAGAATQTPSSSPAPTEGPTPTAVAPTPSDSPPPSPTANATNAALPDAVEVTCTATGTTIGTSRVAVQEDGVHFLVRNASGESRGFDIDGVGGENAPDTEGTLVRAVPIGVARIWCGPPAASEADWISIEVLDPSGFYIPDKVECGSEAVNGSIDYVEGAKGRKGDPVAIARQQITGLRAGDEVGRAGYRRSDAPEVRVVRDGKVVAVATYASDGAGGWLIGDTTACTGTGLGWGS